MADRPVLVIVNGAAADMLFVFTEHWLALGHSMIAENACYYQFAAPRFRALAEKGHALIIEVSGI